MNKPTTKSSQLQAYLQQAVSIRQYKNIAGKQLWKKAALASIIPLAASGNLAGQCAISYTNRGSGTGYFGTNIFYADKFFTTATFCELISMW
ncbi:MAG: hypothetical protein AB8G22_04810 [Saprospiraceae bacterium]